MAWGIDVEGRRMNFAPWPLTDSGTYFPPNSNEIESVYGISGSAVAETLLYFESCGGETDKLIALLDFHIIQPVYAIDRDGLLDPGRWYTNEYYFYFIMFTKKLIGRYDFHFGEGNDGQLSGYHRKYEQGFLDCIPYGQGDEDVTNAIPFAFYTTFIIKMPDFSLFLDWADLLCLEKGVPSYKENIFPLRDAWINTELIFYLYEFAKVLTNLNDVRTIIKKCFDLFTYSGLTLVPKSLLPKAFKMMMQYSTTVFDVYIQCKKNSILIDFWWKETYDRKKFGVYSLSCKENANKVMVIGYPLGLQNSFHLSSLPDYQLYSQIDRDRVEYKIQFINPFFLVRIVSGALSIVIWLVIGFLLNDARLSTCIFELSAMLSSFALSQFIPLYLYEHKNAAVLSEHSEKNFSGQERTIVELQSLSQELLAEKKNLEEKVRSRTAEIEIINQKLREYDKSKTDFFYNVSHELRTPLTLIRSPLEALRNGRYGKTVNPKAPVFDMILRNVDRLNEQVDMLLDFASIDQKRIHTDWVTVDLAELCSFFFSELVPRAESAGVILSLSLPEGSANVTLDIKLFQRAFFNLALNSLKFTPPGGTVRIALRTESDRIELLFEDSGIGIPNDKLERIFERFVQLDISSSRRYEGTGLGLALVKEVCEILGATIRVESDLGKGSRFFMGFSLSRDNCVDLKNYFVTLPRSAVSPDRNGNNTDSTDLISMDKSGETHATILLVEDTADMRDYLKKFLCERYRVLEAANGQEALGLYRAHAEIDLVITDIMMPLLDGRELHRTISRDSNFRHIPFLFITARASPDEKIETMAEGAVDYIYKPFLIEEVLAKTDALLSLMKGNASHVRREIAGRVLDAIQGGKGMSPERASLESFGFSGRELDVARRVLDGKSNKEIAAALNLSAHTVAHHINSIYKKTGTGKRLEFLNRIKKDI